MVFNFYPPTKSLQHFIKGYLEADSSTSKVKAIHKLFPNGFSGIFFNFGNLGKLSIKEEYETPSVSIFGQIDQCFEAIHLPGSYSLGVLLEPTVLSKFLRVNMSEFTNKTFNGASILKDLHFLHEQLEGINFLGGKIEILDHFFIKAFSPLSHSTSLADHALQLIHHNSSLSIKSLATTMGVSERHLEKQFKKHVGLSPKIYAMIVRFKTMEQLLISKPKLRWGKINFADQYYDQNHFIKEFKRFTGHTPSDYLLNSLEMGRSYLVK